MDTPSIVKVLRYLKNAKLPVSLDDIIIATEGSQTLVLRALDTLAMDGIITSENNTYSYASTPKADDLSEKLFQLYPAVNKQLEMELTLRGVICHLSSPPAYLRVSRVMEIMVKDGHCKKDIHDFLRNEKNFGYIESLWINFKPADPGMAVGLAYNNDVRGKIRANYLWKAPCPPPLTIPFYYLTSFFEVSAEGLRNIRAAIIGEEGNPEEYINGNYPAELTDAAVKHFLVKKTVMAGALQDEARREWEALRPTDNLRGFTYGMSG